MSENFKILSFNFILVPFIWRPYKRIKLFSKQIKVLGSDLINLQEVHTYDNLWLLRKQLSDYKYVSYRPGVAGPKSGLVYIFKTALEDMPV